MFRRVLFNTVSVLSGTGYSSEDYGLWGPFPIGVLFVAGLIGGCSGSATCAIKIFRFQVLFAVVASAVQRIHSPAGVFIPRYERRPIDDETIRSVMAFFYFFALTLGLLVVALSMIGLSPITALSGAASALANIGPGFGPEIGPSGNFATQPDSAKLLLAFAMLLGRLELLSVFVLLRPGFWRE
jgi:trk system potassium uptake protein TrkH